MRPTFNIPLLAICALLIGLFTTMVAAIPTPENALSLNNEIITSTAIDSSLATTPLPSLTTVMAPVVKLHLFTGAECKGMYRVLNMEADTCYGLNSAQALRVIDHDAGLKYNALRVTRGEKCDKGWELQPLEEACSSVGVYGSIKVLVNTKW
ncbi:hypothetical protein BKA63DRAFT_605905 [Paraphoma chrysanthemicola]|nr:hypothetical protein BKA63DRAFT_605905 [Paraphoma chrysanthemicola]